MFRNLFYTNHIFNVLQLKNCEFLTLKRIIIIIWLKKILIYIIYSNIISRFNLDFVYISCNIKYKK